MTTAELIGRARQGDGSAFGIRTDPCRRELHVHRYRTPGADAGPEARYQRSKAIPLASVSVLQLPAFGSSSRARFDLPGTVQA